MLEKELVRKKLLSPQNSAIRAFEPVIYKILSVICLENVRPFSIAAPFVKVYCFLEVL